MRGPFAEIPTFAKKCRPKIETLRVCFGELFRSERNCSALLRGWASARISRDYDVKDYGVIRPLTVNCSSILAMDRLP